MAEQRKWWKGVIPAKAGIQNIQGPCCLVAACYPAAPYQAQTSLDSCFRRNDTLPPSFRIKWYFFSLSPGCREGLRKQRGYADDGNPKTHPQKIDTQEPLKNPENIVNYMDFCICLRSWRLVGPATTYGMLALTAAQDMGFPEKSPEILLFCPRRIIQRFHTLVRHTPKKTGRSDSLARAPPNLSRPGIPTSHGDPQGTLRLGDNSHRVSPLTGKKPASYRWRTWKRVLWNLVTF